MARKSSGSGSNGRSSSARSRSVEEFEDYSVVDPEDIEDGPDVLLDVPVVKVDEIDLEVENLRAQVSVTAEVRGSWSSASAPRRASARSS